MAKLEKLILSFSIKELEKKLEKEIYRDSISLGVDTASRTGWCIAITDKENLNLKFGFVSTDSKDTNFKYKNLFSVFSEILDNEFTIEYQKRIVIIEDVFFGRNVGVLKFLARAGMLIYTLCEIRNISKTFILATSARSKLGLKGIAKKDIVQKQAVDKFGIKLYDSDLIDAFILAINGLIKDA